MLDRERQSQDSRLEARPLVRVWQALAVWAVWAVWAAWAVLLPGSAAGQLVAPPETLWGDIDRPPEGLQVGGVELLAGLLLALLVIFGACAFLAWRHQTLLGRLRFLETAEALRLRSDIDRLRRVAAWAVYALAPLLGLGTILIAGSRSIFGVEVALLAIVLSLLALAAGLATLLR